MAELKKESQRQLDYRERADYDSPDHKLIVFAYFDTEEARDVVKMEFERILARRKKTAEACGK